MMKGPWRDGRDGQFPSYLPSWFPARGLLPNCPNIKYCLGIHVTLTKETGVVPPPSHAWTAPLVEDMLHYARTGLTEAVVTGPGRAVLFYGRHSLGEGLSPDESRDAAFMLIGVGTLVGKPAYLATHPLTIQEGWQEIAQAITECQIKARALGIHMWICQPHNYSDLTDGEIHPKGTFPEMLIQTTNYHLTSLLGARTIIDAEETRDSYHVNPHHHSQTTDLKATGVQCQLPHQCHHCQTG